MAAKRSKRTGRFVRGGTVRKRATSRRRKSSKRTVSRATIRMSRPRSVAITNPRRRRRGRKAVGVSRRNPSVFSGASFGLNKSTLESAVAGAGGFLGVPFVEGFIMGYLPSSITGNKIGMFAVKAGAGFGLSYAARKFLGKDIGNKVAIGAAIYIGVSLIKDFIPQLMPGATGTGRYLRAQPNLGKYISSGMGSAVTQFAPSRLQPGGHY